MELICPACQKWIEIPERQIVVGGRCRCNECWGSLRVVSVRPLQVELESQSEASARRRERKTGEGDERA